MTPARRHKARSAKADAVVLLTRSPPAKQASHRQDVQDQSEGAAGGGAFGHGATGLYPYVTSGNGELAVVYARGTSAVQIVLTRLSASLAPLRELVVRSGPSIAHYGVRPTGFGQPGP